MFGLFAEFLQELIIVGICLSGYYAKLTWYQQSVVEDGA
jgi:hypothetical protein